MKFLPGKKYLVLAVVLFHCGGVIASLAADTNGAAATLRPFYIIGHEADTLEVVEEYLVAGANGVECNVNTFGKKSGALCIGHGPWLETGPGGKDAVPLQVFLKGLHELARVHTNFCLVYFDCKSLAATPALGRDLLEDIRAELVGQGTNAVPVNAIISVGKLKDKAIFANIANDLGPREGIMVDGYSRPGEVSAFFDTTKAVNRCFSDGTVPFNTCLSHFEIYWALKKACRMRERDHKFCFVGTWTVNNPVLMRKFIRMGVDGILTDRKFLWYNFSWENMGHGLGSLARIVQTEGASLGVRLANLDDNPFLAHQ